MKKLSFLLVVTFALGLVGFGCNSGSSETTRIQKQMVKELQIIALYEAKINKPGTDPKLKEILKRNLELREKSPGVRKSYEELEAIKKELDNNLARSTDSVEKQLIEFNLKILQIEINHAHSLNQNDSI